MPGIRVITDSACDLPPNLAEQLDIDIVPLTVRFGAEELVDRRDLTPKEFWARCATSPVLPETAAPSPGSFEEAYRRASTLGAEAIVCITLSSDLSATYQAAQLAAESVAPDITVRVIDSKSLTMGQGMMAAAAAEAAAAGKGLDDVVGIVDDMIPRQRTYAALDTLENLKKGGRIGAAQAMLGSMLSIKPIIEVTGGFVQSESKQRTRSKSLRYLVDKVKEHPRIEHLAVMHGDAPDIDEFVDMLTSVVDTSKMTIGDIGAVIGTHAGPRTIGVTFSIAP